jgi:hypothetical protein
MRANEVDGCMSAVLSSRWETTHHSWGFCRACSRSDPGQKSSRQLYSLLIASPLTLYESRLSPVDAIGAYLSSNIAADIAGFSEA